VMLCRWASHSHCFEATQCLHIKRWSSSRRCKSPVHHSVFHQTTVYCINLPQIVTHFSLIAVIRPQLLIRNREMKTSDVHLAHRQIKSHHISRFSGQPLKVERTE
jgi:hypothetical protein